MVVVAFVILDFPEAVKALNKCVVSFFFLSFLLVFLFSKFCVFVWVCACNYWGDP